MTAKPMQIALLEAENAGHENEVPVGAVVVYNRQIISRAHNLTRCVFDPTGHAEIRAIKMACQHLKQERLINCDLYVTLEPCAMCAAAISFARIRRLYYAAPDIKGGAVENGARFYNQPSCHHAPDVYSGLGEQQSAALLKDFFAHRRKYPPL